MNRTITSAICGLALAALWAAGAGATPVARLEQLAATDLLPEVRAAAGMALGELWVDGEVSDETLAALARDGATAELRAAAQFALAARTVGADLDADALQALAAAGEYPAVRARAAERLAERWLAEPPELAVLQGVAETGATPELRGAAVPALSRALSASAQDAAALAALANGGPSDEVQAAAARALLDRLGEDLAGLTADDLLGAIAGEPLTFARVVGQDSADLRAAAAAALAGHFADPDTPLAELEAAAGDPANSVELRRVAAAALGVRLLRAGRSLEALTAQAQSGATAELQGAAVGALEQALVLAVGRGAFSLQQLVDALSPADSDALNAARANAAFTLLRPNLIFVTDQPLLEAVVRGERVVIGGVSVDGADPFLRRAATAFLGGLFLQFGAVNRFERPLDELLAMAQDETLAAGFRQAAGTALVKFLSAQRQLALDAIVEIQRLLDRVVIQGRRGQTEEALNLLAEARALIDSNSALINTTAEAGGELGTAQRLLTIKDALAEFPAAIRAQDAGDLRDINTFVSGQFSEIQVRLAGAPDTSDGALLELAATAATPEARGAAAAVLAQRLLSAARRGEAGVQSLTDLALEGRSPELQSAAVPALAQVLAQTPLSDARLLDTALEGRTPALRRAAAEAWIARGTQDVAAVAALANGSGVRAGELTLVAASAPLQAALAVQLQARWATQPPPTDVLLERLAGAPPVAAAAGELLAARFVQEARSRDELVELAVVGAPQGLREAASTALAEVLIAQRLSESELLGLAAVYTLAVNNPASSPELAAAITAALAERFLHPLPEAGAAPAPAALNRG